MWVSQETMVLYSSYRRKGSYLSDVVEERHTIMNILTTGYFVAACLFTFYSIVDSEEENNIVSDDVTNIHKRDPVEFVTSGLKQFAIDLLLETSNNTEQTSNVVISPYSVWQVLVLISEGARGKTASQIRAALNFENDSKLLRAGYRMLERSLQMNMPSVELGSINALFTDMNRPVTFEFQFISKNYYHCNIISVNFSDPVRVAESVNEWVERSTHGVIKELISTDNINQPELILANAVSFRGNWDSPFIKNVTFIDNFYNENGNVIGKVQMMFQHGPFLHGGVEDIKAQVLELPYEGRKFCILLLLPYNGTTLSEMLQNLKRVSLDDVYKKLKEEHEEFMEDGVRIFLPRVSIHSDVVLKDALQNLGIKDVFNEEEADLSGMSLQHLHLSELVHKARVEVTEEGTVASSVTAAHFAIRSVTRNRFYANRPFAYFIIQKKLKIVLFAGVVAYPPNSQD